MHSTSTLTVSRERQKPASSIVKPACMPNTRNAATSVHTVLMGLMMPPLVVEYGSGGAGAAGAAVAACVAAACVVAGCVAASSARVVPESIAGTVLISVT